MSSLDDAIIRAQNGRALLDGSFDATKKNPDISRQSKPASGCGNERFEIIPGRTIPEIDTCFLSRFIYIESASGFFMIKIISDKNVEQRPRSRDTKIVAALGILLLTLHAATLMFRPLTWLAQRATKLGPSRSLQGNERTGFPDSGHAEAISNQVAPKG